MADDDKTIGEVYRLVASLKDDHGRKLDAIDTQVRLTNGRTTTLEANFRNLESDVQALKQRDPTPQQLPSLPVSTNDGESLSIKITPKMWALLASIVGGLYIFVPIIADWLKGQMGK